MRVEPEVAYPARMLSIESRSFVVAGMDSSGKPPRTRRPDCSCSNHAVVYSAPMTNPFAAMTLKPPLSPGPMPPIPSLRYGEPTYASSIG